MGRVRTSKSREWMRRHVNDPFVQRAQREGWRSRAAYKLIEIADRDRLLRAGQVVLDLGAAPGGWSQVARQRVGAAGRVVAVDVLEMAPLPGVEFLRGDFETDAVVLDLVQRLGARGIDLVLSDMAPNLSGIGVADQARMMALAEAALAFAVEHLKPEGALLVKSFHGAGFDGFLRVLRQTFERVVVRKPAASRGGSRETYLLASGVRAASGPHRSAVEC